MKKVLNFLTNTKKGQNVFFAVCAVVMISLVIGLILAVPIFWMSVKEYEETWMNTVAPYFFYPFLIYAALFLFLFVPYMWYIATSEQYKSDSRGIMKSAAILCSLVPGAFIYSFIVKALFIPTGALNIVGMFVCGLLYLWIVKIIFKKSFGVAQTFIPLS